MKVRVLGDYHYNVPTYLADIKDCESSIQLGDLAFNFKFLDIYKVDAAKHKFFKGNHDSYDPQWNNLPHDLGDYGPVPSLPNSFFMRGAWSIDQKWRREGIDWWADEELSYRKLQDLFAAYATAKPDIVLSHQTADDIVPLMGLDPGFAFRMGHKEAYPATRTGQTLNMCLNLHRPKLWLFGHYHRDFDEVIHGTRFICLTADPNLQCKQRYFDIEV